MPIEAKLVQDQVRCGLEDCNKLLLKGKFTGRIEVVCKCGALNIATVSDLNGKPMGDNHRLHKATR